MSEPKHYESLIVKKEEGIGWITLNRPHRLNTLTADMVEEMHSVLNDFEADKEVKCIVITGAGDKAFSAGARRDGISRAHARDRCGSIFEGASALFSA